MKTQKLLLFSLLTLCLTGLVGCQSTSPSGSKNHASVKIPGRSQTEVRQTAIAVFREDGYALAASTTSDEMVFERPGGTWDGLKWGGWSGTGVTMRVKVQLRAMFDGVHLLEADAFAVQNSEDPFFQSETRNILLSRRPYQKLLDEVAKRLK